MITDFRKITRHLINILNDDVGWRENQVNFDDIEVNYAFVEEVLDQHLLMQEVILKHFRK